MRRDANSHAWSPTHPALPCPARLAVQVCDFGLSTVLAGDSQVGPGMHGTVTHMPPEVLEGGAFTKVGGWVPAGMMPASHW